MRRALALALVAALFGAIPATSAASHGASAYRTSAGSYTMPGGTAIGTSPVTFTQPTVQDTAKATEDSVAVRVNDPQASVVALAVTITPAGGSPVTKTLLCNGGTLP